MGSGCRHDTAACEHGCDRLSAVFIFEAPFLGLLRRVMRKGTFPTAFGGGDESCRRHACKILHLSTCGNICVIVGAEVEQSLQGWLKTHGILNKSHAWRVDWPGQRRELPDSTSD
jgi:hypothetical protein